MKKTGDKKRKRRIGKLTEKKWEERGNRENRQGGINGELRKNEQKGGGEQGIEKRGWGGEGLQRPLFTKEKRGKISKRRKKRMQRGGEEGSLEKKKHGGRNKIWNKIANFLFPCLVEKDLVSCPQNSNQRGREV